MNTDTHDPFAARQLEAWSSRSRSPRSCRTPSRRATAPGHRSRGLVPRSCTHSTGDT